MAKIRAASGVEGYAIGCRILVHFDLRTAYLHDG